MVARRKINTAKNIKVRRKISGTLNKRSRNNQIDHILDIEQKLTSIDDKYGPIVYKELQSRLEKTIDTFNKDVEKMFSNFKTFNKKDFNKIKTKAESSKKPKYITDYEKSKKK